ncbi:MAG: hypothetical protein KBE09_02590 [Candidatus Pacebacteria bacterium]|nr:hypothetical protein [Candidatus Paceibacterota bacterium]
MSDRRTRQRALLGILVVVLSAAILVLIFYFFQKDQRNAQLRLFSPGGAVPVLVSVLGAADVEQRVTLEYGVEHDEEGRLFSERVTRTLRGAEVLTQEISLPETIPAGEYAAFVNIADEHGVVLEAGRVRFEVRAPGLSLPHLKIFLLYVLFCVALCIAAYTMYVLVMKRNRVWVDTENT